MKAERIFEGYMRGIANRLERAGARYGVEIQPAANANGRVWNFVQFGKPSGGWTEKLYAFPGSRRLDVGIVDLTAKPNEFGLRPLVMGYDITVDTSKRDIVKYYQEYFGNIPIIDLRP